MKKLTPSAFIILMFMLSVCALPVFCEKSAEREEMYKKYLDFSSYIKGGVVTPHWMKDGNSFWYAEGAPENTVIYKVDPPANTKEPLFDTLRIREALKPLLGHDPAYKGLPFDSFTFVEEGKTIRFTVEGKDLICNLDTYTITAAPETPLIVAGKSWMLPRLIERKPHPPMMEIPSPDGKWFLHEKDHNIWLRSSNDGRMMPLTEDGIEDYGWYITVPPMYSQIPAAHWSSDSLKVSLAKVDTRKMAKFPIIHWLKPFEEIEWQKGFVAGGPMEQAELFIMDVISKKTVPIATGDEPDLYFRVLGWLPDGSELLFLRNTRDYKKLDLMAADSDTGVTRVILTEERKTFVIGAPYMPNWVNMFTPLADGKRFFWISDRDGWDHLYLYDMAGKIIRRLTKGTFPVIRVVSADEEGGWIYFTAHGEERVYDTHLYRVNFEGLGFQRLTEAPGQHGYASFLGPSTQIQFSPSKKYFIDTFSSTSQPPKVELRKADGALLQVLAEADIKGLKELKWSPPEEFVVKAADGNTDIYGIMYKPYDFDPNKKYPVIDSIYGGPQITYVPRTFSQSVDAQALAQMGFIVIMVDARGTPERSKAFQDVVYGKFGTNEIPDHAAAIKQLASERPYMDLSRVGIYGGSWGGYMTLRAMFTAPDVYHVGVATSPIPDPSTAGTLHEIYLGLPGYNNDALKEADNTPKAANLQGKLLVVHGTSDSGCRTGLQMQLAEALIRAGKFFDLIMLPERGHGLTYSELLPGASPEDFRNERLYTIEATRRYFVEHLKPLE